MPWTNTGALPIVQDNTPPVGSPNQLWFKPTTGEIRYWREGQWRQFLTLPVLPIVSNTQPPGQGQPINRIWFQPSTGEIYLWSGTRWAEFLQPLPLVQEATPQPPQETNRLWFKPSVGQIFYYQPGPPPTWQQFLQPVPLVQETTPTGPQQTNRLWFQPSTGEIRFWSGTAWRLFVTYSERTPSRDLSIPADQTEVNGAYTDGTTLWICDRRARQVGNRRSRQNIKAYTLATGARDPSKDIDTALNDSVPVVGAPIAAWGDGDTVWVSPALTGSRNTLALRNGATVANFSPRIKRSPGGNAYRLIPWDLWGTPTHIWIAGFYNGPTSTTAGAVAVGYRRTQIATRRSGQRTITVDISARGADVLPAGIPLNRQSRLPRLGIWGSAKHIYLAIDNDIRAFDPTNYRPVAASDFRIDDIAPTALTGTGDTLYVPSQQERRVYTYRVR